jgi:DNA polymerase I-like protein with 3'-5' exonuclease and polymerase domains|tara:strand:- start:1472 stop:3343 length:1872 start_codon:yes stop_codon:yes gene_type:complete
MSTQRPLFEPPKEWNPPQSLPDLSEAKEIAIDLETYDPGIKDTGPGWATDRGHVVGIAVAVDGWKGYFPIRHEGGGNFDEDIIKQQLKKYFENDTDKIFHNASYDVGWLKRWGINVKGRIIDTMVAAAIIDENRMPGQYNLNAVAKDFIQEKKDESLLYEAAQAWQVDAKAEMYKLPYQYVGPYAEQDADLTLRLWKALKVEINRQELHNIFNIESELLPILVEMKWQGVRIDLEKADKLKKELQSKEKILLQQIKKDVGFDVEIFAPSSVAQAFDKKKIAYNKTPTGLPSFDKNFLATLENPLAKKIVEARELFKARSTFIDSLLKHEHNGRIHGEINQLKSDQGGTITGRLSMSNPNLQQIPARNQNIGPLIRSLFIPEEGHKWGSFDYSQQEPRLVVHFAALTHGGLEGADEFVHSYQDNPDTDFHQIAADMAVIDRKTAKTMNLGLFYGMGQKKLGSELGLDEDDTKELFEKYHSRVPFVKELMGLASKSANDNGQVRTILGRICHFDLWEPTKWGVHKALPRDEAIRKYGSNLKRAFIYKALNKLIQGSAADQTKKAMIEVYKAGIIPHIQVHDELNCSCLDEKQINMIKDIMENCIELEVPSKVDPKIGDSWGTIKN